MSESARESERAYHEGLYANHGLYEPGTWLYHPASYAIQSFEYITPYTASRAMDLGSGVGRHSIPLAKHLGPGSQVVCADILDTAIAKLRDNARVYGVEKEITGIVGDVEALSIESQGFDFILSVSCIEHLPTKPRLEQFIRRLQEGTRPGGVHCFMMITDNVWQDILSGESLEPLFEQNLISAETTEMLERLYEGWQVHDLSTAPWESVQSMNEREIRMKSTSVRFIGQKPSV